MLAFRGIVFRESFGPDPKLADDNSRVHHQGSSPGGVGNAIGELVFLRTRLILLRASARADFGVCSEENYPLM
jgi:hypothetical protein